MFVPLIKTRKKCFFFTLQEFRSIFIHIIGSCRLFVEKCLAFIVNKSLIRMLIITLCFFTFNYVCVWAFNYAQRCELCMRYFSRHFFPLSLAHSLNRSKMWRGELLNHKGIACVGNFQNVISNGKLKVFHNFEIFQHRKK